MIKYFLKSTCLLCLICAIWALAPTFALCADEETLKINIVKAKTGGAPEGWEIKDWHGPADVVEVIDTPKGNAIHLKSGPKTSTSVFKDIKFDIRKYPYVTWRWKVTKLPPGADVRNKDKDDQAAQFYVVFPRFPAFLNSRLVGYIWDTTAPVGTQLHSTKTSTTRYIVLKSGEKELGKWFEETRNVYEDYKRLFGEEPTDVGRVSFMIDSDDTHSIAESYVSGIYFSKTPPKGAAEAKPALKKEDAPQKDIVPAVEITAPVEGTSQKQGEPAAEEAPPAISTPEARQAEPAASQQEPDAAPGAAAPEQPEPAAEPAK